MTKRELLKRQKEAGAATRAMYFPYEGTPVYLRLCVAPPAAKVVDQIPETERSRFLTEAIQEEHILRNRESEKKVA